MLGTTTKLKTARNIKLQGAVSGNANFDGSANITINTTQTNIAVLDGRISLTANPTDNASNNKMQHTPWSMDYTSGFSKDNSIVICFRRKILYYKGVCLWRCIRLRISYSSNDKW